jgi:hypothetical protein
MDRVTRLSFRFFSWITFPQAPEITLGSFQFFSKIRGDIRKSRCTTGVIDTGINDTGGKFCHQRCQRYRRHICHRCHHPWHRQQICYRCYWHRWQIMGTISGCRHHKVNLKAKIYIYVDSCTQRCSNKIIKIFLIEDFFHLPPVSTTPLVHFELRISPRIFEKIWNSPNGTLRGLGETDSWKNQKSKISWQYPFK